MQFEHLIEINDFSNPFFEILSREQVWQGLLHRVEHPEHFLPGLERCEILSRGDGGVERLLNFGAAAIRDRVTLSEGEWVRFDIVAGDTHAGGSLTISLEERRPSALFLRFVYQTNLDSRAADDAQYIGYVKSAYEQSDIDTVRVIRTLATGGNAASTLAN